MERKNADQAPNTLYNDARHFALKAAVNELWNCSRTVTSEIDGLITKVEKLEKELKDIKINNAKYRIRNTLKIAKLDHRVSGLENNITLIAAGIKALSLE